MYLLGVISKGERLLIKYMQTCQNGTSAKSTLGEIAKELNMSKRNLQRALRIERNLTDSMKGLLDTGEM